MKNSYNRLVQKPRTANVSKKNSGINSVLYKQIGQTLKEYKDHRGLTRRDRASRNSNNNICDRQNSSKNSNQQGRARQVQNSLLNKEIEVEQIHKKQEPMPFTYLQNHKNNIKNTENFNKIFDEKKSMKNIIVYQDITNDSISKTCKKSFLYKYIIGKGGFGKVWKVEHNKTRNQYAMKQMLKSLVMTKKSVQSVMNERLLLSNLSSPFIVNMHYAFQDRDTLYLVLDLLQGGDLRHHISTKKFTQIQAKFFISCIVLGLQYLHGNKIIHRDIKPQNLVLDSRGYVRITDLGIARIKKPNNSCDTSGTPGYMSPEVICRMNHGFVSDFYALGIIAYQLATGKRPHNGYSRNEIRQQILSKQASIKINEIPNDWSQQCVDFINKLIHRKAEQRLGFNGIQQIKNHPWIRDLNWKKLATRDIQSPFIPLMKKSDFDQDEQITIQDQQQAQIIEKNSLLLRKPQFQDLFKQYFYEPISSQMEREKQREKEREKQRQKQRERQKEKEREKEKQKEKQKSRQKLLSRELMNTIQNNKSGLLEINRRKNSTGSYNPGLISVKGSYGNLKKTNVSTNNSIDITATNISGTVKNSSKNSEISSRNTSGNVHRKMEATSRQSRDNILSGSQYNEAYGLGIKIGRDKDKDKQRPFFKH